MKTQNIIAIASSLVLLFGATNLLSQAAAPTTTAPVEIKGPYKVIELKTPNITGLDIQNILNKESQIGYKLKATYGAILIFEK